MRRSRWLVLLTGWALFGAAQSLIGTVMMWEKHNAGLWMLGFYLPLAWVWALMTPAIGWWARVVAARVASPAGRWAAHVPSLLLAALVNAFLRRTLLTTLGDPQQMPLEATLLYFADLTIASYVVALWMARVLDANERLSERDRQTHALQSQLVNAQMEYLELQLRPHFLFNALSTIAELGHQAPKKAARMLRNVIALLEAAVARQGRGLVSLADELRALEPYLAIQRLRFSDWLVIEEDVADGCRAALVPQFILQPLVENAVHHGLLERRARGQIAIRGTTDGRRLRIAVMDNGVGLTAASYHRKRGIGLANLRARLKTIYGNDATLELTGDTGKGTAALVDIPFRVKEREGADAPPHAAADSGGTMPVADDPIPSSAFGWASRHPVIAAVAVWTIIGLLRIEHSFVYLSFRHRYTPEIFAGAIRHDATAAVLWLLMTPIVLKIARLLPARRGFLVPAIAAHTIGAMVLALSHTAILRILIQEHQFPLLSMAYAQVYAWNVAVYAFITIMVHFRTVLSWIRDREVAAGRLRQELQEARFQRVILELRPQVLIDALEHLVTIVATNARRAEAILADIGEFLRSTLDAIDERNVPLRAEGASLRAYARMLQVTSAPELSVQLSIPQALMGVCVPNGVLRAALDSVLGENVSDKSDIRLDVASDAGGILVCATAATSAVMPPGRAGALNTLSEYQAQGGVQLIKDDSNGLWLRIDTVAGALSR